MSVPTLVPIIVVDVEVFHRISQNFDLLVALKEKTARQTLPSRVTIMAENKPLICVSLMFSFSNH